MSGKHWWAVAALVAAVGCAGAKPAAKPPAKAEPVATVPGPGLVADPPAASETPSPAGTLFDRLGGMPAVEAVIGDFMGNVAADERINAPFAVSDLKQVQRRLVEFVCVATGGPCKYTGRDMKAVHHGMGVTGAQWDALVGDLVKSLEKFKVPEKEKSELLGALGPLREQVVEVE